MSPAFANVGYSGTPLPKKLGMKPGQTVAFIALPDDLAGLAVAEPFADVDRTASAAELGPAEAHDLILAFHTRASELQASLGCLKAAIKPAGMIWIAWPKKAAKVDTDITEDVIRKFALPGGLVDVKVCAISEVWSGLKLVIPVADRRTR